MKWQQIRKIKEMHDEYLAQLDQLRELGEDVFDETDLLACKLADPQDLKNAFLAAFEDRFNFPGPAGYANDDNDEVEPFESERPILQFLLRDTVAHLDVEVQFAAHQKIIAKYKAEQATVDASSKEATPAANSEQKESVEATK